MKFINNMHSEKISKILIAIILIILCTIFVSVIIKNANAGKVLWQYLAIFFILPLPGLAIIPFFYGIWSKDKNLSFLVGFLSYLVPLILFTKWMLRAEFLLLFALCMGGIGYGSSILDKDKEGEKIITFSIIFWLILIPFFMMTTQEVIR